MIGKNLCLGPFAQFETDDLLEAKNERLRFLIFDNHEIPNKQQIKAIVPVLCLSGYMYAHVLVHVCVKFSHQIKY